ncbi:MAG: hypothetical protein IJY86_06440 [Clostridia bacterium]|nr:hypothetical protein [Clostridia bacterium]
MRERKLLGRIAVTVVFAVVMLISLPVIDAVAEDLGESKFDFSFERPRFCDAYHNQSYAQSHISENGSFAFARTVSSHDCASHGVTVSVYVEGDFWFYPEGATSYQTVFLNGAGVDDSDFPRDLDRSFADAEINSEFISGKVFCLETKHKVIYIPMNAALITEFERSLTVGEPAVE